MTPTNKDKRNLTQLLEELDWLFSTYKEKCKPTGESITERVSYMIDVSLCEKMLFPWRAYSEFKDKIPLKKRSKKSKPSP